MAVATATTQPRSGTPSALPCATIAAALSSCSPENPGPGDLYDELRPVRLPG